MEFLGAAGQRAAGLWVQLDGELLDWLDKCVNRSALGAVGAAGRSGAPELLAVQQQVVDRQEGKQGREGEGVSLWRCCDGYLVVGCLVWIEILLNCIVFVFGFLILVGSVSAYLWVTVDMVVWVMELDQVFAASWNSDQEWVFGFLGEGGKPVEDVLCREG